MSKSTIYRAPTKRGTLEIVVTYRESSTVDNQNRLFHIVQCSECSKDPELFGEGLFKISKGVFDKGGHSCACAPTFKWTARQHKIRVERHCREMGYEVVGYPNSEWKGIRTYVRVRCLKDGFEWNSQIGNLLTGRGCSKCKATQFQKTDDEYKELWKSLGNLPNDMSFKRLTDVGRNSENLWECHCPTCAADIYTENDLCTGKFVVPANSLAAGYVPCRCGVRPALTREQQELKIKTAMPDQLKFVRWVSEYKTKATPLIASCSVEGHGEFKTTANTILTAKHPCPKCGDFKFDKTAEGHFYVMKIVGPVGDFTGYGISCNLEHRLKTHRYSVAAAGYQIDEMETFPMWGHEAWALEDEVLAKFPHSKQEVKGFRREATHSHLYLDVIAYAEDFLQRISDESKLTSTDKLATI